MIKNYFKIALRNLRRSPGFSFINIFGMAIGMAACLLILQYVTFERSYDDFHPDVANLYRIELDNYQNGKLAFRSATSYPAIAPTMKKDFPEVMETARLYDASSDVVTYNNVHFREDNYYFADNSIFKVFNIDFLKGEPASALSDHGTVVMSETTARKYFGDQDPMGKTVKLGQEPYIVRGVYKDYPKNSHLELDLIFSYLTDPDAQTNWGWYDFFTYVKLRPGTDPKKLEAKLPAMLMRHKTEAYRRSGNRDVLLLQPVRDIHLYSNLNQEAEVNGNGKAVQFLLLIAFFILVIAWINYVNLATARALDRAKEVGIRKVVGADRTQLIRQFLLESFLLNLAAAFIALLIVSFVLPSFNELTARSLSLTQWSQPGLWAPVLTVLLMGSLLSGLYPAFVLSGFRPIAVLKGKLKSSTGGLALRQSLIVFQFGAAVVLIVGTLTVYRQLRFMQEQDLGFATDQMLVLRAPGVTDSTYDSRASSFKTELVNAGLAQKVTASAYVPGIEILWTSSFRRKDQLTQQRLTLYNTAIDYDFLDAYQIKLAAGRNFSLKFGTDSSAVLLNEAAAELLGFDKPSDALNKELISGDTLHIVGVVKNYHQQGLRTPHWPMLLRLRPASGRFYSLKVKAANLSQTVQAIKDRYDQFFPNNPFEYFFLDTFFDEQYRAERQFGLVFGLFAGLAIFVASLGLFGLAAFMAGQRTKEIGIRKVLGASVSNIFLLLSKDFLKLILVAFVLSIPVAWYLMSQWLSDFAYRTTIGAGVFVLAGVLALLIALITVSYQAIKAAVANPVTSLRME